VISVIVIGPYSSSKSKIAFCSFPVPRLII
jgi:hypothetical protein